MQENLIFTGFSGTGKSRVGKIVAKIQSVKFIDIDQSIVLKTGTVSYTHLTLPTILRV